MAKILVVDDEAVLVKGIRFNLQQEGYQVETGSTGSRRWNWPGRAALTLSSWT